MKKLPLEQAMERMWLDAVQMSSVLPRSSSQKLIGVEKFSVVHEGFQLSMKKMNTLEFSDGQTDTNLFSPH